MIAAHDQGLEAAALDREVHVWTLRPETVRDPALEARCLGWLSPEELERRGRFIREADQRIFGVAHALVRLCLSRYGNAMPSDWRFVSGEHGRPEIESPRQHPRLRFNLSHTRGLVACVVARELDCGVDVERVRRSVDSLKLARRFFAAREQEALAAVEGAERERLFYRYWTLKEAYLKARGLGLAGALSRFAFELDASNEIRLHCEGAFDRSANEWGFDTWRVDDDHQLAVAVRWQAGVARAIVHREADLSS